MGPPGRPIRSMHIGKPEFEQLSTVLGGTFFGILACAPTRSCGDWLPHRFVIVWVVTVAAGWV